MEIIRPLAQGNGRRLLGVSLWWTARMMMSLETLKVSHRGYGEIIECLFA